MTLMKLPRMAQRLCCVGPDSLDSARQQRVLAGLKLQTRVHEGWWAVRLREPCKPRMATQRYPMDR